MKKNTLAKSESQKPLNRNFHHPISTVWTRPPSPFIPLDSLGPRTSADGSSFHNISTMMTSPPSDKLSLPHMQFVANSNTQANIKEEPTATDEESVKETNDDFSSMTRNDDSPPNTSRQILDTIPEQD